MAKANSDKKSKYKIHPIAALFPMMTDDELNELANDIKDNGLIHPIVKKDGLIIDGRNRLKACELANVEPQFTEFDGESIEAYIVSANLSRRNLTKGQQAMAYAMIYPEPSKGGRGKTNPSESKGFSFARLSQARNILRFSRELAEDVLAGTKKLDAALEEVDMSRGKSKNEVGRLARLRDERPDLADSVDDETMTLEEAEDKAKEDENELLERRNALTRSLVDGLRDLDREPEEAENDAKDYNPQAIGDKDKKITPERLRHVSEYLIALADAMESTKPKKGK
jgi:hypothetical protein